MRQRTWTFQIYLCAKDTLGYDQQSTFDVTFQIISIYFNYTGKYTIDAHKQLQKTRIE